MKQVIHFLTKRYWNVHFIAALSKVKHVDPILHQVPGRNLISSHSTETRQTNLTDVSPVEISLFMRILMYSNKKLSRYIMSERHEN